MDAFNRVKLLVGEENLKKLQNSTVAVFGIGGVGGFAAEALVRSGVGSIVVIDGDEVEESNLNRQIIATVDSVGMDKVAVMKNRLLSINPNVKIKAIKTFYLPENAGEIDFSEFDYVIDAVDTVSAKVDIIKRAKENEIPVITCLGTGGKLDITKLRVSPVSQTKICPLARVMRRELKAIDALEVKAVWSEEEPLKTHSTGANDKKSDGRTAPPSMIFVPAAAGLMLAREAVAFLMEK